MKESVKHFLKVALAVTVVAAVVSSYQSGEWGEVTFGLIAGLTIGGVLVYLGKKKKKKDEFDFDDDDFDFDDGGDLCGVYVAGRDDDMP